MLGMPRRSARAPGGSAPAETAIRLRDEHEQRMVVLKLRALAERAPGRASAQPAFGALPRRPQRRAHALRAFGVILIALGALALADAAVTLVWQEPISALYAKLRQEHLGGVLRSEERTPPPPAERRALASISDERARVAFLAGAARRHAGEGAPVGRIVIPRIGASFVVVAGTSTGALQSGPGIFEQTPFPGVPGTTAIAGHRTTFLAPFRHIDELRPGNRILLNMPYAHFTYTVTGQAIVAPTDVKAAVGEVGYSRLVLSACTPLFSAAKRLLVYARLQSVLPVGAGRVVHGQLVSARPIAPAAPARRATHRSHRLPAVLETAEPHLLPPFVQ